ncbi:hypothetical protein GQ53DRAFT_92920 [Thozetella sp. PMI_491]|nr:hypothetical protein GQ53DRAFT_92920 [Thozetella sp. PMI_491]
MQQGSQMTLNYQTKPQLSSLSLKRDINPLKTPSRTKLAHKVSKVQKAPGKAKTLPLSVKLELRIVK